MKTTVYAVRSPSVGPGRLTYRYREYAEAQAEAQRLRRAGVSDAEVYRTTQNLPRQSRRKAPC